MSDAVRRVTLNGKTYEVTFGDRPVVHVIARRYGKEYAVYVEATRETGKRAIAEAMKPKNEGTRWS